MYVNHSHAQSFVDLVENVGRSLVKVEVFSRYGELSGMGSGFFVSSDGRILTNEHVIREASSIRITYLNGTTDQVSVLSTDPKRDLALLKIPVTNAFPAHTTGQRDLRPGQRVVAIGNPLGFEKTVSDGMLSGVRVSPEGVEYIQTTVPISPGSSGGLLLNEKGEVIGITTAMSRIGQNINFAVSINEISAFLKESESKQQHATVKKPVGKGGDMSIGDFVKGAVTFFFTFVVGGIYTLIFWIISQLG
jgi:S1-C subfamily serine protease